MCGLGGYIGKAKNPKDTYKLITNIFKQSDSRGIDASGVWATTYDNKIIYDKEPVRSSIYIREPFWKNVSKQQINLMLIHARGASRSSGSAYVNSNNHPFVSNDKSVGLIHNGIIHEFLDLKEKFQVSSDCDSEILLRIFESQKNRMQSIQDIWSFIPSGHMAVAIGEYEQEKRNLFLFRNDKRPIWIADLRKSHGQIFFFSSDEIWFKAIQNLNIKNYKLIELPANQLWTIQLHGEELHIEQFKIHTKNSKKIMTNDYHRIIDNQQQLEIIAKPELCPVKPISITPIPYLKVESISIEELDDIHADIISTQNQLVTELSNSAMEGSIDSRLFWDTVDGLKSILNDLQTMLAEIKSSKLS
jgi:glucosamine 6-phosphate synthetase-like amidotransferase/phosphosugar isomerase protein